MVQQTMHQEHQKIPTPQFNNEQTGGDQIGKQQYPLAPFFQLTGHNDCFKPGIKAGTILKRVTGNEEQCLKELMKDKLSPFVPKVYGTLEMEGQFYLEMQNLLTYFKNPAVLDIKMGCRTYREEELDSALREGKLRPDMYNKMLEVDENEPTALENKARAITKPRYMIWRETVSSTASLSFRIEGMCLRDGTVDKDFKLVKEEKQIAKSLVRFARSIEIRMKYLRRLCDLKRVLLQSKFFWTHELIGSSLLFVHDDTEASIWIIDFAKTYSLPENVEITHQKKWELGNHEDGFLKGIDNLIRIFESIISYTTRQLKVCSC